MLVNAYMDVGGRATQEAKAETSIQSLFSLGFALSGEYLLFKKKVPRKPFPGCLGLRLPKWFVNAYALLTGPVS